MRIPGSLKSIAVTVALCCSAPPALAETQPSNIVLIIADDLGVGDVRYLRSGPFATPNLDRLSRESTLFTNAYVTLTIRYTSLWHGSEGDSGELSQNYKYASIYLFRTVKNQSGPFYQRVTSAQIPNDLQEYSVTFTDTLNDAGLTALGYGFLYTNGGILPSQPAPPS